MEVEAVKVLIWRTHRTKECLDLENLVLSPPEICVYKSRRFGLGGQVPAVEVSSNKEGMGKKKSDVQFSLKETHGIL